MDERILKYFQNELTVAERLEFLREAERDETLKRQFVEYQNIRALAHLSSYGEDREEGKKKYSICDRDLICLLVGRKASYRYFP